MTYAVNVSCGETEEPQAKYGHLGMCLVDEGRSNGTGALDL